MRSHDTPSDGQAQPDPTRLRIARLVAAIEGVEKVRQILNGHAGASVSHAQIKFVSIDMARDLDRAVFWGMSHGVVEQVRQHAL